MLHVHCMCVLIRPFILHLHIEVYKMSMYNVTYNFTRPYSSTLGKAKDTEIFRNMDNFEKVHVHVCVSAWV